jgi:hypothetical protein
MMARMERIYDWRCRVWFVAELIDLGQKPSVVADPDAALQQERWPGMTAQAGISQAVTAERTERLCDHIRQHGPVTLAEIGDILNVTHPGNWLDKHGKTLFQRVGFLGRFALYGLRDSEE